MTTTPYRKLARLPFHLNDGRTVLAELRLLPNATAPTHVALVVDGKLMNFIKVGDREYHQCTSGVACVCG